MTSDVTDLDEFRNARKLAKCAGTTLTWDRDVEQIRALAREIFAAEGEVCTKALNLGDKLKLKKDSVRHGGWLELLKAGEIHPRLASRYLLLAAHRALIEEANRTRESNLSIAEALRLIRESKRPNPPGDGPEPEGRSNTPEVHPALRAWNSLSAADQETGLPLILAAIDPEVLRTALPARLFEMLDEFFRAQFARLHPRSKSLPALVQLPARLSSDSSIH